MQQLCGLLSAYFEHLFRSRRAACVYKFILSLPSRQTSINDTCINSYVSPMLRGVQNTVRHSTIWRWLMTTSWRLSRRELYHIMSSCWVQNVRNLNSWRPLTDCGHWRSSAKTASSKNPDVLTVDTLNRLIMVALWNRGQYIFALDFYISIYLPFFSRLISAAAGWMSTILWHMVWP